MSDRETQDRATAERIAAEVYDACAADDKLPGCRLSWKQMSHPDDNERATRLVLAGMRNAARRAVTDESAFTEWLVNEMPEGTIVGCPRWWATKILARIAALSSPVGLDAERREAARKALTALAAKCSLGEMENGDIENAPYVCGYDEILRHRDSEYPAPAPDRVVLTCVVCGIADKGVLPFAAPTGEPAHIGLSVCVGALGAALAARVGGQP